MDFCVRSDLACEGFGTENVSMEGVVSRVERVRGITVRRLLVESEAAADRLGRPRGAYLTFECGNPLLLEEQTLDLLVRLVGEKLREMAEHAAKKAVSPDFCVLVAGLGNAELTADAIGPRTVGKLTATRHLREHEATIYREWGCASLAAFAPGVMGQTGMEAQELLLGAVRCVRPDLIVVVDALAARGCERLASTVQLSDTGISPGSGVGNRRAALNAETLGVPVLAIGVPTVVDSSTLVYDALRMAGIEEVDPAVRRVLENGKSFFVSLKESDLITRQVSSILARSIEYAFLESV